MNEGDFDHSLGLLNVYPSVEIRKIPFKYFIMWIISPQFKSTITDAWSREINGSKIYSVVQKLKAMK